MKAWLVTAAAAVLTSIAAAPSFAQNMPVSVFLAKADALEKQGMMAMMSSDLGIVKAEMKASGAAYRAQINGDKNAGRPPHSCPPPKITMSSDSIMAQLRKVPVTARPTTSVRTAFMAIMKRQYPCPR